LRLLGKDLLELGGERRRDLRHVFSGDLPRQTGLILVVVTLEVGSGLSSGALRSLRDCGATGAGAWRGDNFSNRGLKQTGLGQDMLR